ncbi:hypothetical protein T440DRAFT_429378, partial [Plenodomus tracheiphilus IPT5]
MARRTIGFVSKKPHRKSRGGCLTCKKKKVKCDEGQPSCGYCLQRSLFCEYFQYGCVGTKSPSCIASSSSSPISVDGLHLTEDGFDFNKTSLQMPSWLIPAAPASTGQLSLLDHELLHHYKTKTWRTFAVREDSVVHTLHRDSVPQLSISHPYLLYALLSIAASHRHALCPSEHVEHQALIYRQKTFSMYTEALKTITAENYEGILVTATFLLALVPPPAGQSQEYDEAYLDWMLSLLKLSEGLRILASLRWAQGIEKLSVYPLICRELRTLPPPPLIVGLGPDAPLGPLGSTPEHPNPAPTYRFQPLQASPLFLPPSLMQLLQSLTITSDVGPLDFHCGTIKPALYAMSPIFLSLYYYHLNQDFYVRICVFTSFLMPDFLQLVRNREPRALVLVAWWFALADLVPKDWWVGSKVGSVVEAIGRVLSGRDATGPVVENAFIGAHTIIKMNERRGRVAAAECIFEDWEGIDWDGGPRRADQWEIDQFLDLGEVDLEEILSLDAMTVDVFTTADLD